MSKFDSKGTRPAEPAAALEADLRRRFDVVEQRLAIAGRTFDLLHPRSADDLINDDDFNRDERLPYWAEFWPSAYVLAQRVASEPAQMDGHRKRLLELGCGSGLVTVSALAAGFTVTAIDYYPEALDFVRLNAMRNRLPEPRSLVVDWRQYPDNLADFDVVVAADVLYERDYCQLIAAAFKQSLRPGELGILTDPQRTRAEPFPDACRRNGLKISPPQVFGPLSVPGGDAAVRQTVNLFEIRCGE